MTQHAGQPDAPPASLHVEKERGMTVVWADGRESFYSIALLRRMSPSAEARQLREEQARNPLTVLSPATAKAMASGAPLTIVDAEMAGNYALRIRFSDGHHTGLYSWAYLREIEPK